MHLSTAFVGGACDAHGRDFNALNHFNQAVLHKALGELDGVNLAISTHNQTQPSGQCVNAGNTHTMQAARYLVAVLIELAARMQFGQRNF